MADNKKPQRFPADAYLAYGRILGTCMAVGWGIENERLEMKVQDELLTLLAALGWVWREGRFQNKIEKARDATT